MDITNTETTNFLVTYDGEALRDHSMDVEDLCLALSSLGDLFKAANNVLNKDKTSIKLHVVANKQGSFVIAFQLIHHFLTQSKTLLISDNTIAIVTLAELTKLVMGSTKSIFWFIKKLKGQKPNTPKNIDDNNAKIEIDNETITIPLALMRLCDDIPVRKALEKTVAPLEKDGIDSFEIKEKEEDPCVIKKDEVKYYKMPDIKDEQVTETIAESAYSIISLAFKEDNKWRLYDGSTPISVNMKDKAFLYKVANDEISFSKGDTLICEVKKTQYRNIYGELKNEYEVIQVKEHKPAPKQLSLFTENET